MFQFTHPGKGATLPPLLFQRKNSVSIHAPWEGCDYLFNVECINSTSFNSRTLGRVRLLRIWGRLSIKSFNSRTLGRVRLYTQRSGERNQGVSIHAPWEGCDLVPPRFVLGDQVFQFTHPGKGATRYASLQCYRACVFQFTHPGKGATLTKHKRYYPLRVSIHAPWEGCDSVVQSCVL